MCQAIRDGGRRCSIHRHTSIGVIRAAVSRSGLTRYQVERLFAELRKEGHNARRLSQRQRERIAETALAAAEGDETLTAKIRRDIDLGWEHDADIDGQTGYALRVLHARAAERSEALQTRFQQIADRAGITRQEVAEKYAEYMNGFERPRGGAYPEEYNQNTRRRAALDNLPYDVASVYALERVQRLGTNERRRRVQHVEAGANSQLASYGYDNGRLEIVLRSNPDQIYAYRNVPESLWTRMSASPRPTRIWINSVRNNDDYAYVSAAQAEEDAYAVRCASCGQFAALSGHSCPERVQREELAAQGLTGDEIREELAEAVGDSSVVQVDGNEESEVVNREVLPAPETVEEEESEAPVSNEPVTNFVLPASEYEAYNAYENVQELEVGSDEQLPDHIDMDKHFGTNKLETLPEMFSRSAPTVESQLDNTYANSQTARQVLSLENYQQIQIVNSETLRRLRYGRFHELERDQEFLNKVNSTPTYIHHIVVRQPGGEPVIYGTYDDRVFTASTTRHIDGDRNETRSLTMRARGLDEDSPVYTEEEAARREREGVELVEALSARDDVVVVEQNTSSSRRFLFDRYSAPDDQPKITSGKVSQVRRALREGKVAVIPVTVETNRSSNGVADATGIKIPAGYTTISGHIAVRRREDGSVEVINDERTLKCDCRDYRNKYSCPHIRYVNRNIANVVAKQAHVPAPGSYHNLLSSGLASRGDVRVFEPRTLEDGTTTEPVISFGEEMPNVIQTKREGRWEGVHRRALIPESLSMYRTLDADTATFDQVRELYGYVRTFSNISFVEVPGRPSALRTALKRADLQVPVQAAFNHVRAENGDRYAPVVKGAITFKKAETPEETSVVSHTLKCSCPDYQERYDCEHVRFALSQPAIFLNSGSRDVASGDNSLEELQARFSARIAEQGRVFDTMIANPDLSQEEAIRQVQEQIEAERIERERLEQERIEQQRRQQEAMIQRQRERAERLDRANSATVEASNLYRASMMERWSNVEGSYSENLSSFYNDVREAERRKAAGEPPIEFRTENVTDGICGTGEGTRSFGVELEFDVKRGVDRSTALRNIGRELNEAGLTASARMQGYHSGARTGWAKWSFESDVTVAGEIVSPIMKDTPEHWEQLRKVCEIITRNGGVASVRTGSHVHISTGSYGMSTAKHAELLRQSTANQDILFRLAANPGRGKHRGSTWCPPNVSDRNGDVSPELREGARSLRGTMGHRAAVNFDGTSNSEYKKSHAEFRMWDGSLDPAVIQQQIVISAAVTDLAERRVIENEGSFPASEPLRRTGHYRQREIASIGQRGTHTEETFADINADAAKFIDSIVRTPEQRKGIASLFAITKWQS